MQKYENTFLKYIGARSNPNQRELDWVLKVQGFSCKAKYIPGIEMLSICNSVSFYASNKNSDIDLFVITRPGYIWLVRLLLNILAYLSGVRRPNLKGDKKKEVSGKICLSFFVANNHLNLTDLAIKNDIYLYFWLRYLKPIISRGEIYSQFLLENCIRISPEQKKENTSYQIIQNIQKPYWDAFWKILNKIVGYFMKKRALKSWSRLGEPLGVVISDDVLKFHDQDRRKEVRNLIFADQ